MTKRHRVVDGDAHVQRASPASTSTNEDLAPPDRLAELVAGGALEAIAQPAMRLDVARWLAALPDYRSLLEALPASLDRESVRAFCDAQTRDADGVIATFIASQIWGYGDRGYGPHRVAEALACPDLVPALQCAADDLDAGRPLDAFDALCVVFTLPNVGMSFGTKYLFFADRHRNALILDRLVGGWLAEHTRLRLKLARHPPSYRVWLKAASRWAVQLRTTPEKVELLIFTDALPDSSRWRAPQPSSAARSGRASV